MKILVIIPLWKRPEIFKICASNLENVIKNVKDDHQVSVITIVSPEDSFINDLVEISMFRDFEVMYCRNNPISAKLNMAIDYSMRYSYDYLMNFGSDNLIHPDIFSLYGPYLKNNEQFFGVSSLFAYDFNTGKTVFIDHYNGHKPVGVGRMISKKLIDQITRKGHTVYDKDINRGMDVSSARRITSFTGVRAKVIESANFPYIVDIKTEENINPFDIIKRLTHKISNSTVDVLRKYYPHIKTFL